MKKKTKKKKPKIVKKRSGTKRKSISRIIKKNRRTKKGIRRTQGRVKINQEQIDALLKKGEERGFVTSSEILHFIPNIESSIEELERIYDLLKEKGIELRETKEFLELKSTKEKKQKKLLLAKIDPIQMYLKEIGKASFLSAKEERRADFQKLPFTLKFLISPKFNLFRRDYTPVTVFTKTC